MLHACLVAQATNIAGMVDLKVRWSPECQLSNLDEYRCRQPPHHMALVVKAVHAVHGAPAQQQPHTGHVVSVPMGNNTGHGQNTQHSNTGCQYSQHCKI